MAPPHLEKAFFGMGCWLNSEPRFGLVRGVWKTTVGYGGGNFELPSHGEMGDLVEAVMVEYDPNVVSYGQLLEIFIHCIFEQKQTERNAEKQEPKENAESSTFPVNRLSPNLLPRHAPYVFTRTPAEKRLAEAAIDRHVFSGEFPPDTPLLLHVSTRHVFYEAELWRQKYFLRSSSWLMAEVESSYPDESSLVHSTLAARLNGILGRTQPLSTSSLPEKLDLYDLSESALSALQRFLV
jgi:peptide-methionine (S)-S-oxide reductase